MGSWAGGRLWSALSVGRLSLRFAKDGAGGALSVARINLMCDTLMFPSFWGGRMRRFGRVVCSGCLRRLPRHIMMCLRVVLLPLSFGYSHYHARVLSFVATPNRFDTTLKSIAVSLSAGGMLDLQFGAHLVHVPLLLPIQRGLGCWCWPFLLLGCFGLP